MNFYPQGLSNIGASGGNIMSTPNSQGSSNGTRVIPAGTTNSDGSKRADVYQLTDNTNQLASVWSTDKSDFDLSKKSKLSAWVWMGSGSEHGDGWTFALQNDSRGANATGGSKDTGQSLGIAPAVPGTTDNFGLPGSPNNVNDSFYNTAVANSFDIEFDNTMNRDNIAFSAPNGTANGGNKFDGKTAGTNFHIATMYPASASAGTFVNYDISLIPTYYWSEIHSNVTVPVSSSSYMGGGKWHHFMFDYTPPQKVGATDSTGQASASYTYDDLDFDSTTGKQTAGQNPRKASFAIDTSKFYENTSRMRNSSSNPLIKWGFTAANGTNFQNTSIIFETAIGVVTPETTLSIADDDKQSSINNQYPGNTSQPESVVTGNDHLTYTGQTRVLSGSTSWKNVKASFDIGTNVKYQPNSLTVNGTHVDDSNFTIDANGHATLSTTLPDLSAGTGLNKIQFGAYAINNTNSQIESKNQQVNFVGDNALSHSTPFNFLIDPITKPTVTITSPNNNAVISDKTKLPSVSGTINAGSSIDASKRTATFNGISVPITINGNPSTLGKWKNVSWSADLSKIPASSVKIGNNQFVITITDSAGNTASATINLVYNGYMGVTANANSSFTTNEIKKNGTAVPRNNDWGVQISTDMTGTMKLTAQATQMKLPNGKAMLGSFTYIDSSGNNLDWVKSPQTVFTAPGTGKDQVIDVAKTWKNYTFGGTDLGVGPRLTANTGNAALINGKPDPAKQYSSTIKWTLTNSV